MAPEAAVPAGKQWPEIMQLNTDMTWNPLDLVQENADFWIKGNEKKIELFRQNPPFAPKGNSFFFFSLLRLLFQWMENSQPAWVGKLLFLAKAYADVRLRLAPTKNCG